MDVLQQRAQMAAQQEALIREQIGQFVNQTAMMIYAQKVCEGTQNFKACAEMAKEAAPYLACEIWPQFVKQKES